MTWRRKLLLAVAITLPFVGLVARALIFPGQFLRNAPPCPADAETWWLDSDDGPVEAWFFPAGPQPGPTVIYAHGNGEFIADAPIVRWYLALGVNVAMVEFRGFGRSAGTPSEDAVAEDLRALRTRLLEDPRVDASRLIYHGRSLGGGAVGTLVREHAPAALVLESTFTSLAEVAQAQYYVPAPVAGFLLWDTFATAEALTAYDGPSVIFHGQQDRVIPPSHGRALAAAAAGSAHLIELPGGHNNMTTGPTYYDAIRGLLERNVLREGHI